MKTQEHTAGPWISTVIHPQYILNSKQQAFLVVSRDNGPAIDDATFTANCKLIAAAPQLLEALESVRDLAKAALTASALSGSMQFGAHLSEIRDVANDAIKSAKGETP